MDHLNNKIISFHINQSLLLIESKCFNFQISFLVYEYIGLALALLLNVYWNIHLKSG